jgi:NAD(P)-dependent dehydrogenase (short-subunit alcohol dehydrogenase family)
MSVWFVTGASRGFGAQIVEQALAAGHQVVATARKPESVLNRFPDAGEQLLAVALDVTDQSEAVQAAAAGVDRFGRIDVVVNNAGRGLVGAVEEVSDAEARSVFDTNVFGTLNVLRAVLPTLRKQRSGRIFNLSSVAGFTGAAGWGVYASTKFAVEGFSEALAVELAPLGIYVTVVEPGYFRTDFLDSSSLHRAAGDIEDYAGTAGATRVNAAQVNHAQPGDPAKAAAAILRLSTEDHPPMRIQLGRDSASRMASKLQTLAAEQDAWRELSLSTDHDDVAA